MSWRRLLIAVALIFGGFIWLGSDWLAKDTERKRNGVRDPGPYEVSERAAAMHRSAFVVDLHADTLLWNRDLLERGDRGQVDLPRLVDGGVGLQVFGIVTHAPKGQNFKVNDDATDLVTPLVMAQKWPPGTWSSRHARALYQAEKLRRYSERSDQLEMIGTVAQLDRLLERRAAGEEVIGAFLGLEGAHALESDVARLDSLFDAGFRMIGLAHFIDNDFSGSAHGASKGGLSEIGRELVRECQRLGLVVDLAHASPTAFQQAIEMSTRPMVISHGGVDGTCPSIRNTSDEELRLLAGTGGVIGIGLFKSAVCGSDLDATIEAMMHAISVVGVDHVALGSDFDGSVTTPFGVDGLPLITEALLERGLSEADIQKILGDNVVRVLRATLPR